MCVNVAFTLDARIFHIPIKFQFLSGEVVQGAPGEGSAVGTGVPRCFPMAVGQLTPASLST